MPTNDERREVAARLRDYESLRETFRKSPLRAFVDALGIEGYLDWEDVWGYLADLIEPEPERTCQVMRDDQGIPRCGECECIVYDEYIDAIVNYCPTCGAKVIE